MKAQNAGKLALLDLVAICLFTTLPGLIDAFPPAKIGACFIIGIVLGQLACHERAIEAVSYTHLDVYKRQVQELTLTVAGVVPTGASGTLTAAATVTPSAGTADCDTRNNSAQVSSALNPMAVTLADFSAVQTGDPVVLTWETNSELHNRGFNLYRGVSSTAPDRQLNDALIPSQSQGNPGGFIYTCLLYTSPRPTASLRQRPVSTWITRSRCATSAP